MYKFKVTKTCQRNTSTQVIRCYEVKGDFFAAKITYYGNQGYDAPEVVRTGTGNDYFLSLNTFMKAFYSGKVDEYFSNLKEGQSRDFELEYKPY